MKKWSKAWIQTIPQTETHSPIHVKATTYQFEVSNDDDENKQQPRLKTSSKHEWKPQVDLNLATSTEKQKADSVTWKSNSM